MKNKKNIYILLPIVLFVWGGVLYQVFSFTNTDNISPVEKNDFVIKPHALARILSCDAKEIH